MTHCPTSKTTLHIPIHPRAAHSSFDPPPHLLHPISITHFSSHHYRRSKPYPPLTSPRPFHMMHFALPLRFHISSLNHMHPTLLSCLGPRLASLTNFPPPPPPPHLSPLNPASLVCLSAITTPSLLPAGALFADSPAQLLPFPAVCTSSHRGITRRFTACARSRLSFRIAILSRYIQMSQKTTEIQKNLKKFEKL